MHVTTLLNHYEKALTDTHEDNTVKRISNHGVIQTIVEVEKLFESFNTALETLLSIVKREASNLVRQFSF